MSRTPAVLVVLTFAGLALAGCIEPPIDTEASDFSQAPQGTTEGRMTAAEEASEVTVAPCVQGGLGFCATRTVRIAGEVAGMPLLDVGLANVNGPVGVTGGSGDAWSVLATLRGAGTTPEKAREALDRITFTWSHESPEGHFLNAEVHMEGRSDDDTQRFATLDATLPRALALRLVASTTNGDVAAKDLRTDGLSLTTTNGEIDADATVTQARLGTTNGKVTASLTPSGSGRIALGSTNGEVKLKVPEESTHGYDVTASTTNGEADITLRDGDLGPCPQGSQYYTPPCNHRTFTTNDFRLRDVQSTVTASTTNGDVSVERR